MKTLLKAFVTTVLFLVALCIIIIGVFFITTMHNGLLAVMGVIIFITFYIYFYTLIKQAEEGFL